MKGNGEKGMDYISEDLPELTWEQIKQISTQFGTAIPPPWNLWWSDLPITYLSQLIEAISSSRLENNKLVIPNVVSEWPPKNISEEELPKQISESNPRWTMVEENGVIKSSLMTLGVEHFHSNGDIIITNCWEALIEGLGLGIYENKIRKSVNSEALIRERIGKIEWAMKVILKEEDRVTSIENERDLARVEATTAARQSGLDIEQTKVLEEFSRKKIIDNGQKIKKI